MARLIDGKLISKQIKDELKEEVAQLKAKGGNGHDRSRAYVYDDAWY